MRICFKATFATDGDYWFEEEKIKKLIRELKTDSLYNKASIFCNYEYITDYQIEVLLIAEGDNYSCKYALRDLLEELICNFRTFKYWLVKDMYDLLYSFLQDLFKKENQYLEKWLTGNYDGTYVVLSMES